MDVYERLVGAGVELLETKGLAALTQRQIAARAGVSHGAPRHHFPTYANLLGAIARVGVEVLDARVRQGLAIEPARDALVVTCRSVVDFAIERPGMFELVARHDLLEGAGGDLRAVTGGWFSALTRRIREVRPDADERRAVALWAGVQGLGLMFGRRSVEVIAPRGVDVYAVVSVLIEDVLGDG